ncbi:hypothetical protein [Dyadobacter sp. 676]|uniref:DUF393 domain-containing protein n=1 Tax=Dyadobacter sp. 676 TaxID=3088362 RepID=A0AAU8FMF3_9BACT
MKTLHGHIILYDAECTMCSTFKLAYRIAWIAFAWLLTSIILASYTRLLTGFLPADVLRCEFTVCAGQIFFRGAVVFAYKKPKAWDYLGNLRTVSLAGALGLLICLIAGSCPKAGRSQRLWIDVTSVTIYSHAEDRPQDVDRGEIGFGTDCLSHC